MDIVNRDWSQLRNPRLYIVAKLIVVVRLFHWIEDKHSARAYSTWESPPSIIGVNVVVYQSFFEVMSSISPVLLQVLREIASHDHAASVRHKACSVHIPHKRVYKGHSSFAFFPSLVDFRILLPIIISAFVDPILTEHLIAIVHTPISIVVSPEQLINVRFSLNIRLVFLFILSHCVVYFTNWQGSTRYPRTKLAGIFRPQ